MTEKMDPKQLVAWLDQFPLFEVKPDDVVEYDIAEDGVVSLEVKRNGEVVSWMLMSEDAFNEIRSALMSDPNNKSHICVDFDGVIHSYSSGWQGACVISDDPVPGALEWLADMVHGYPEFQICVYSSRSKEPGAIDAMKAWLLKHYVVFYRYLKLDPDELEPAGQFVIDGLEFPTQKPAANMMIDDRAFHFEGTFPTPAWLKAFKPWNKRGPAQTVLRQELLVALKRDDIEEARYKALQLSTVLPTDDKDIELFKELGNCLGRLKTKITRFG